MKIAKTVYDQNTIFIAPDQFLFKEGDPGDKMYIVLEGEVELLKKTSSGSSVTLFTIRKGDFFGEMALVENKARSASAVARGAVKVLVMNEDVLFHVLATNPDFALKMIKVLATRLRNSNLLLEQAFTNNVNKTVYEGLVRYAKTEGRPGPGGRAISGGAFCTWASEQLGVAPQTTSDILKALVQRSFLKPGSAPDEYLLPQGGGE